MRVLFVFLALGIAGTVFAQGTPEPVNAPASVLEKGDRPLAMHGVTGQSPGTPSDPASAAQTQVSAGKGSPQAGTGSAASWDEVATVLELHNRYRQEVGVPPLEWSPDLAAWAQDWANQLADQGCVFQHRPDNKYGENIFEGSAGFYGVADAVKTFYAEKQYYHGGPLDGSNGAGAGHYTQMVWRDTRTVGCGKATCDEMVIMVFNYDPPGNRIGESPY